METLHLYQGCLKRIAVTRNLYWMMFLRFLPSVLPTDLYIYGSSCLSSLSFRRETVPEVQLWA